MTEGTKSQDLSLSIRRTLVPILAGYILAWGARVGLDIPAETLTGILEAVLMGVYYTAVRILEKRYPHLGFLLGAARQPVYEPANETVTEA
jgi:hypothetical protein